VRKIVRAIARHGATPLEAAAAARIALVTETAVQTQTPGQSRKHSGQKQTFGSRSHYVSSGELDWSVARSSAAVANPMDRPAHLGPWASCQNAIWHRSSVGSTRMATTC
jgi:hypothetical protein